MPIIKIKKRKSPYVVLDKTFLIDKKLSAKSKGILAYLLSLPPNWEVRVEELTNHFSDVKHAIYSALKELKQYRYVLHFRFRSNKGSYVNAEYHVFEVPQPHLENQDVEDHPHSDFQNVGDSDAGKSDLGNQSLLNNKNNKDINNKIITAARAPDSECLENTSHPAAASSLISDHLSSQQTQCVRRTADELAKTRSDCSVEQLEEEIAHSLLDPNTFSKAGRDFFRKLNTIRKAIREGKWDAPVALQVAKETQRQKQVSSLQQQLRELGGDHKHLQGMIDFLSEKGEGDMGVQFQEQQLHCEKHMEQVKNELMSLQAAGTT